MEGFEVCYTGGVHIEKILNENLSKDNQDLLRRHPAFKENINFPASVIEDVKVIIDHVKLCRSEHYLLCKKLKRISFWKQVKMLIR
jgi:hypothetical protein